MRKNWTWFFGFKFDEFVLNDNDWHLLAFFLSSFLAGSFFLGDFGSILFLVKQSKARSVNYFILKEIIINHFRGRMQGEGRGKEWAFKFFLPSIQFFLGRVPKMKICSILKQNLQWTHSNAMNASPFGKTALK